MKHPNAVVVIARWQTSQAALGEVLAHIADLRSHSLSEPGCLGYEVLQSHDHPGTLMLVERYRDGAALTAHLESQHYRDLVVGRIAALLTDRQVEILREANV